jgi:hypothetical protein
VKPVPSPCAATLLILLTLAPRAWSASSAPPFDVAYRAWGIVTELARVNADPAISGECGKSFRPFVIPTLRRQTRQQEDVAAAACVAAARSACVNTRLRMPAETALKCQEFR